MLEPELELETVPGLEAVGELDELALGETDSEAAAVANDVGLPEALG